MIQKKVEVIPATKRSVHNGGQLKVQSNIRVAAYCRVSTGDESQQTSYTTQKAFYTNLITTNPDGDLQAFMQMRQNQEPAGNTVRISTA